MAEGNRSASARGTPRRADAQRNIDKILDAGLRLYGRDPGASMAAVAAEAGIGRVTLYGHFASRNELAKALVARAVAETVAGMDELDLDGLAADAALDRLLRAQWHVLLRNRNLRDNIVNDVDPRWLRQTHDPILSRVEKLVERGRRDGVIRDDLPQSWLVSSLYSLVHAASDEISAGRLTASQAPEVLVSSLLAMYRPPR